ncbi:MAG: Imm70 family immunity protein [Culicoidibacterales bacterium]
MSLEKYEFIIFSNNNDIILTDSGWELVNKFSIERRVLEYTFSKMGIKHDLRVLHIHETNTCYYYLKRALCLIEIITYANDYGRIDQISAQFSIANSKEIVKLLSEIVCSLDEQTKVKVLDMYLQKIVNLQDETQIEACEASFMEKKSIAYNAFMLDDSFFVEAIGCDGRFYAYLNDEKNSTRKKESELKWREDRKNNAFMDKQKFVNKACYLSLGNRRYYVGTGEQIYDFFYNVWYFYAKRYGNWGIGAPVIMTDLYYGKVSWFDSVDALIHMRRIKIIFKEVRIENGQWSINNYNLVKKEKNIYDFFTLSNGNNFIDLLENIAEQALELNTDFLLLFDTLPAPVFKTRSPKNEFSY